MLLLLFFLLLHTTQSNSITDVVIIVVVVIILYNIMHVYYNDFCKNDQLSAEASFRGSGECMDARICDFSFAL